jgi:ubiquinone biosynthesis protein
MEWMDGTPISDIKTLLAKNIDLKQLSHNGVNIFYTQVFDYGFFHADMHPGNILCSDSGRYIALDFGIVGCLAEDDKRYLAINILAFFNRDYKKVAITHIESGWAPQNTSIEELENAIRTVCEPIFNKPLAQISFADVLIKLFQISKRFDIKVQPQLILLQKTIMNVEGLGRILNPELDLWVTAKPILEKWMKRQMGVKGFINNLKNEIPYWSYLLPGLPRAFAKSLAANDTNAQQNMIYVKLLKNYRQQNWLFILIIILLIAILFFRDSI